MRHRLLQFMLVGLLLPTAAHAQQAEAVQILDPVLRVLPGETPAGGYLTILNENDGPITLTGVTSAAFARGEMHESTKQNGNHRMEERPEVSVSGGNRVAFQPGGYHLMMMGRQKVLSVGDQVTITLEFGDDSKRDVVFEVAPPTYQ